MIDQHSFTINMIKELSDAQGVSGFEDNVTAIVRSYGEPIGSISEDSLRNLYIRPSISKKERPIVQLDAHTDEVGFMIKAVRPNGLLDFIPIGGWIASNVPAHKVLIRNRDGKYIAGIVASKPPHFMSEAERNAPLDLSKMVIDIGAKDADDVISSYRIGIGAPVVPDVVCTYDEEHDLLIGKAFDCRLGCAAILSTMRKLDYPSLSVYPVGAFSSQEEVGIRGATVTSQTIAPDLAIVFEGCPADDTVVESYAVQTAIKKGPMLRHIDARMITNPRFQRFALDVAQELDIPVQEAVRQGGATNGAAIHLSQKGVPVIVIGIPVRYIHTHYGIASLSDYHSAVSLATALINRLDRSIIDSF